MHLLFEIESWVLCELSITDVYHLRGEPPIVLGFGGYESETDCILPPQLQA